jgi:nucleotide-binding universal stress UspA family protein
LEVGPGPSVAKVYQGPYEEFSKEVDARAMQYLREIARRVRTQGVSSVEERLLHGHPAEAIVELSRQMSDNLVAMTTHGCSGVRRWVLGSIADRVVRLSGDPVLVIRSVKEKAA